MAAIAIIKTQGLRKTFGTQVAIESLSLTINKGDIYGFLGLNGAGKSTTLRLLMGLLRPDAGQIELFGENSNRRQLSRIGAMVESPSFYGHLSGTRNIELLGSLGGRPAKARIAEVLAQVGLQDAGRKKAKHYSLGMKQRLAIASP